MRVYVLQPIQELELFIVRFRGGCFNRVAFQHQMSRELPQQSGQWKTLQIGLGPLPSSPSSQCALLYYLFLYFSHDLLI